MQDSHYFVPYHIPWTVGPLYIIPSGSPWWGTDLEVVACCILPLVSGRGIKLLFLFPPNSVYIFLFFFLFIFISWRLITLQYCSGFFHTLTWICHGFTCIPHPNPPSHLPLYLLPLGLPSAPGLSTCLMHPSIFLFNIDGQGAKTLTTRRLLKHLKERY